jgi:hypothetical protein
MGANRNELRYAIQEILNDVIEQGFHHLVNHPQESDELNRIIKDATDELNCQLLKIDSHSFPPGSKELNQHFETISKDTQRKSLELLGQLQQVQYRDVPRLKR